MSLGGSRNVAVRGTRKGDPNIHVVGRLPSRADIGTSRCLAKSNPEAVAHRGAMSEGTDEGEKALMKEKAMADVCVVRRKRPPWLYCDACHILIIEQSGQKHIASKRHEGNVVRYIQTKETVLREKAEHMERVRQLRRDEGLRRRKEIAAAQWRAVQEERENVDGHYQYVTQYVDDDDGQTAVPDEDKIRERRKVVRRTDTSD